MLAISNQKRFYEFLSEKQFENVRGFDKCCQHFGFKYILKIIVPICIFKLMLKQL